MAGYSLHWTACQEWPIFAWSLLITEFGIVENIVWLANGKISLWSNLCVGSVVTYVTSSKYVVSILSSLLFSLLSIDQIRHLVLSSVVCFYLRLCSHSFSLTLSLSLSLSLTLSLSLSLSLSISLKSLTLRTFSSELHPFVQLQLKQQHASSRDGTSASWLRYCFTPALI